MRGRVTTARAACYADSGRVGRHREGLCSEGCCLSNFGVYVPDVIENCCACTVEKAGIDASRLEGDRSSRGAACDVVDGYEEQAGHSGCVRPSIARYMERVCIILRTASASGST